MATDDGDDSMATDEPTAPLDTDDPDSADDTDEPTAPSDADETAPSDTPPDGETTAPVAASERTGAADGESTPNPADDRATPAQSTGATGIEGAVPLDSLDPSLVLVGSILGLAGLLEGGLVLANRGATQTTIVVGTDSSSVRLEPGEWPTEQYQSMTVHRTGAAELFERDGDRPGEALTVVVDHGQGRRDPTDDDAVVFDDVFRVVPDAGETVDIAVQATGSDHLRFVAAATDLAASSVALGASDRCSVSVVFEAGYRADGAVDVVVTTTE